MAAVPLTSSVSLTLRYTGEVSEKRLKMARILRPGEVDDGSFDLELWRAVEAEGRFASGWEMVNEDRAFRGLDGDPPRLQRSVARR